MVWLVHYPSQKVPLWINQLSDLEMISKSTDAYGIAGNIRWCKISDIWPKAHTISRPCRSPMACSTAWWSCSRFMKLYSFHFDHMTDQESLVGHSKIWQNTSCLYPIFTAHSEVKVQANFWSFKFSVFIFACRTHMRNVQKLAPYENFLLYGSSNCNCNINGYNDLYMAPVENQNGRHIVERARTSISLWLGLCKWSGRSYFWLLHITMYSCTEFVLCQSFYWVFVEVEKWDSS